MRMFHRRLTAFGLAGLSLAALGLFAVGCGTTSTAPGATKTVTQTVSPTAPPGPAACLTSDLRLTVGQSNGAAGTIYYPLEFTNTSSKACTMYGYPGVSFVTSQGGSVIGAPAGRESIGGVAPSLITVQPGATAHATLAISDVLTGNQCHSHQAAVHTIQVYPPDQYTALFAPFSGTGCADKSLVVMHVSPVTSGS